MDASVDASVGALGLYRLSAEWQDNELVTREVRVCAVRFSPDGKRVTVRLVDFPGWLARSVPVSKVRRVVV